MKPFKSTDILEFRDRFKNNEDCYEYLKDIKWGKGYKCSKCSHKKWIKGKTWYYRRCQKCEYDESATACTLFHKLKFPILKAFYILFELSTKKKGLSSVQISKDYSIQQKTAWLFKQKAQIAMKSSGKVLLSGTVHVDEFSVGGPEKGAVGRTHSSKNIVMLAIELRKNKKNEDCIGMGYAQCIDDYKSETFKGFFKDKINPEASILTDCFSSYSPLKKDYKKLKQKKSENGKNFKKLHVIIMNFKSWLRGIHHKCDYVYMQRYIDEFFFRFNRRSNERSIFNTLVTRWMNGDPTPLARVREVNA